MDNNNCNNVTHMNYQKEIQNKDREIAKLNQQLKELRRTLERVMRSAKIDLRDTKDFSDLRYHIRCSQELSIPRVTTFELFYIASVFPDLSDKRPIASWDPIYHEGKPSYPSGSHFFAEVDSNESLLKSIMGIGDDMMDKDMNDDPVPFDIDDTVKSSLNKKRLRGNFVNKNNNNAEQPEPSYGSYPGPPMGYGPPYPGAPMGYGPPHPRLPVGYAPPCPCPMSYPSLPPQFSNIWGCLFPTDRNDSSLYYLHGPDFTIGSDTMCNMYIQDPTPDIYGKICQVSLLAIFKSGLIKLNGKNTKRGDMITLASCDEITISSKKSYRFVTSSDLITKMTQKRRVPQPLPNATSQQLRDGESPPLPPMGDVSGNRIDGTEDPKMSILNLTNHGPLKSLQSSFLPLNPQPSPSTTTSNTPTKTTGATATAATAATTAATTTNQSTPAAATTPQVNNLFVTLNVLESSQIQQIYQTMIIPWESHTVSLDEFPYYLNPETKNILMGTGNLFLSKPEYIKYASELSSLDKRVLLEGPLGTETYQDTLIKALARHYKANIFMIDPASYENTSTPPAPSPNSINTDVEMIPTHMGEASIGQQMKSLNPGQDHQPLITVATNPQGPPLSTVPIPATRTTFYKDDRVRYVGNPGVPITPPNPRYYPTGVPLPPSLKTMSGPHYGSRGRVVIPDDPFQRVGVRFDKPIHGGSSLNGLCEETHGFACNSYDLKREDLDLDASLDSFYITKLFEYVQQLGQPTIIYFKDPEKTVIASQERYNMFKREYGKIAKSSVPLMIVCSSITSAEPKKNLEHSYHSSLPKPPSTMFLLKGNHFMFDLPMIDGAAAAARIEERSKDLSAYAGPASNKIGKILYKLFPNKIMINLPKDKPALDEWKEKLDKDSDLLKFETNKVNICKILSKNNIVIDNLDCDLIKKQVIPPPVLEQIIGWAVAFHLKETSGPIEIRDEKLVLSLKSLEYGIGISNSTDPESNPSIVNLKDIEAENEFEKKILSEVIPPNEVAIRFDDIGALTKVKEVLKELVMLPLQRPELFRRGNLTRPCKGILLFGPPGTGKTMLAKAVATESGANFINISMSTIASKWFGEGEKFVRAIFTIASKIAPTVIFVDEVDSMLGKRDKSGEHEAMRKIKNEFMTQWSGLTTKEGERVLVLAATNRPFDIDDAVLRRLSRRLMVDLPDEENRVKILEVILAKEELDTDFDLKSLAKKTEGFTGSDLKSLSVAAAYAPIREFLLQEKTNSTLKTLPSTNPSTPATPSNVVLRPISMIDFEKALKEVSSSVSEDSYSIAELRKWDNEFGTGGNRKQTTLTYYV
eukprot:gene7053-8203_t